MTSARWTRLVALMVLPLLAACGGSPTAPSEPFSDLRWDVAGTGTFALPGTAAITCAPSLTPAPEMTARPEERFDFQNGVVTRWRSKDGVLLGAVFTRVGPLFGICAWAPVREGA